MAYFTGLKELQNHPHKAGFDIGSKNLFTAKVGELLPVYWDMAIPDCDYDIDLAYFTRTRPVQSAAYTSCYRDWETDRKSTRLNSSHITRTRMLSSA